MLKNVFFFVRFFVQICYLILTLYSMKTKLIFFGMLCFNLSFGQNNSNQAVNGTLQLSNLINPSLPLPQTAEVFRFAPGIVTQLDAGNNFDLSLNSPLNSRWFSLGGINTGPGRRAYGLRFQAGTKALTFGYQNVNEPLDINPRIQWIGAPDPANSSLNTLGNLEFRVADSFTSTVSTLVATMKPDGSTIFGDNQLSKAPRRLVVTNQGGNFDESIGIESTASNASFAIGVKGVSGGLNDFGAGIYGQASLGFQQWAGYFDGRIFATSYQRPSDRRLKYNIALDKDILNRLAQTQAVTYNYIKSENLNLTEGLQHGFIAQDLEKVFPELVVEVVKPIFDKSGSVTSTMNFKTIDYMGLISVLTGGIQELNSKVIALEKQLAERDQKTDRKSMSPSETTKGAYMQQNIPNPFGDQTTISYQLPESTNTAEIMVFDLNGRLIKNYPINKNESEITIKASEIGSGLFIYSLVQNGQELMSKKMIVK